MKEYIRDRIIEIADYIIATGATVRDASKVFGVSKSTVHKDMTERICEVDFVRFEAVRKILLRNLEERHIRGGLATKEKYKKVKK